MAACLIAFAAPAAGQEFDWTRSADRIQASIALSNMAAACARDMGFTRLPALTDAQMSDKLQAYLLLSANRDRDMRGWSEVLSGWNQLKTAAKDDALAERGADAIMAALADPDSYADAERLYVETVLGPLRVAMAACSAGAADPFIGKHYWTGTGSLARLKDKARADFASGVTELKAEMASRRPR